MFKPYETLSGAMAISTVKELVEALGDTKVVAEALSVGLNVVSNWKGANRLPAWSHGRIGELVAERGLEVPKWMLQAPQPRPTRKPTENPQVPA